MTCGAIGTCGATSALGRACRDFLGLCDLCDYLWGLWDVRDAWDLLALRDLWGLLGLWDQCARGTSATCGTGMRVPRCMCDQRDLWGLRGLRGK